MTGIIHQVVDFVMTSSGGLLFHLPLALYKFFAGLNLCYKSWTLIIYQTVLSGQRNLRVLMLIILHCRYDLSYSDDIHLFYSFRRAYSWWNEFHNI